ncbi:MAG: radical SAM family heme chaperone HemW [Sinobacteraceae bacterium]|nr:radical SAM family heme chaperone HemW [Nevskiaceae bacterium]
MKVPPLSVYVHFPWCVRKCPYCDFNSYTLQGELPEAQYVDALLRDIAAQAPAVSGREVISVFLGGGTPSLISPEGIARVLEGIGAQLPLAADAEVTLEANPGAIEHGRFTEYRSAGVNRVSLGAQSFHAARLATLGRIHSPDDTRRAAAQLHDAGLHNFNLDLMYALPGQSESEAIADVEAALSLEPAHLSHYQLTLEPGTVFAAQPPVLPDEDAAAGMLPACAERLSAADFLQYEISAYARAGHQSRHNLNYWMFGDYLGIGAGAHGKRTTPDLRRVLRTTQPREPRRYMANPTAPAVREVAREELPFEFMLNALRLPAGFAMELFEDRTGIAWSEIAAPRAELHRRGLLHEEADWVRPSGLGLRFLNNSLLHFLAEKAETAGKYGMSTLP